MVRYLAWVVTASLLAGLTPVVFGIEAPELTLDATAARDVGMMGTPRTTDYAVRATLYWENDGGWAKPVDRNDRHYTAGVGASLAWQAPFVDALLSKVPTIGGEFAPEKTDYAMGLVGSLMIFTPENISEKGPIFNDRPYAGWTYGGLYFQRANRFAKVPVYESLEVDLGILGPSSLAENAQKMIHHYYNYTTPEGWNNQINDDPEFDIKYNRRWKFNIWEQESYLPGLEVMPEAGVTVGSLMDEAHAGGLLRLGWNLPNNFGPGHLSNPGDFTEKVTCGCEDWFEGFFKKQSFYFFARPYGEVVARNALLEGDTWKDNDPVTVTETPALFGVEYGFSHRFLKHFEFTYAWTTESKEFNGQHNWDSWASAQLNFFVAW